MSTETTHNELGSTVTVRRGRVDSVDLFEVKEHELEILENGVVGSNSGLYLNLFVGLFSIGLSALFTELATEKFKKSIFETFIVVIIIVGIMGGAVFFILWLKTYRTEKSQIKGIIKTIRDRINCGTGTLIVKTEATTDVNIQLPNQPTTDTAPK